MNDRPPVGVYEVGSDSPDRKYPAHLDPRLTKWLADHGIDFSITYRVDMGPEGAGVYQYKQNWRGQFYEKNGDVARKPVRWVAE